MANSRQPPLGSLICCVLEFPAIVTYRPGSNFPIRIWPSLSNQAWASNLPSSVFCAPIFNSLRYPKRPSKTVAASALARQLRPPGTNRLATTSAQMTRAGSGPPVLGGRRGRPAAATSFRIHEKGRIRRAGRTVTSIRKLFATKILSLAGRLRNLLKRIADSMPLIFGSKGTRHRHILSYTYKYNNS